MKLKRLSLFLALVMILSAFAGTFTITSATTTTDKPWQVVGGEAYETFAEAINGRGTNTTIKLTADYTRPSTEGVITVAGVADDAATANVVEALTIDLDGHTWTLNSGTGRYLNPSSGNVIVQNGTMLSYVQDGIIQMNQTDGGQVFLKNLNITTTGTARAFILNQDGQTMTLENCVVNTSGKSNESWLMSTFLCHKSSTLNIINSTIISTNSGFAVIEMCGKDKTNTLNITNSRIIAKGYNATATTHGILVKMEDAGTRIVNIENSVLDASGARSQRLIYAMNGVSPKLTIKESMLIGSTNTNDIGQIGVAVEPQTYIASGNLTLQDVVCVGGGYLTYQGSQVRNIFRIRYNYDTGTTDDEDNKVYANNDNITEYAYDSNSAVKVIGRTAAYATDEALLAHFGKVALAGSNYDEVAASIGYLGRIGDAATAYANGAFTGYYTDWEELRAAITNGTVTGGTNDSPIKCPHLTANKTVAILKDIFSSVETTYLVYQNAALTLTVEGIDVDGDGIYPTITASAPLYRAAYATDYAGQTAGKMVYKNLNFKSTGWTFMQVNYGTLTLDNVDVTIGGVTNGAIVVQKGTTLNMINSTIKHTDTDKSLLYLNSNASVSLSATANITNSTLVAKNGAAIYAPALSVLNVSQNGTLVIDAKTAFKMGATDSFTLNGQLVDADVVAGEVLGASIRIVKNETTDDLSASGIRFESQLTTAQINAAKKAVNGDENKLTYGTVIFRREDLGTMSIADLVAAANASETDALKVADIPAVNGIVDTADGKIVRAALVNIKTNHYDTQFAAVAYIELKLSDNSTMRIYGTLNEETGVRSMVDIAKMALAHTATEITTDEDGYYFGYALDVGEKYYDSEGVEQTVASEGTVYSPYSRAQREMIAKYLVTNQ